MADLSEADTKEDGSAIIQENFDQAIIEQVNEIQSEVASGSSLVSLPEDVTVLSREYSPDDVVYQAKLKDLFKRYSRIRKTRGDGNCFFRSFGFACLEASLSNPEICNKLAMAGTSTKDVLVKLGYPAYTVEDFHETFLEVIGMTMKGASVDEISEIYNNANYSDYFIVFLRLMVSGYLQKNEDFYSAFIEGRRTMKEFCSLEVEPMSKESDHIHIIALSAAVGITVQVEYLDRGGKTDSVTQHQFPDDGSMPCIYLLYRPGHYDILYPKVLVDPSDLKNSLSSEKED